MKSSAFEWAARTIPVLVLAGSIGALAQDSTPRIPATAVLLLGAQAQSAIDQQYFQQGVQLEKEGRYAEAAAAYTAALDEVERRLGPEHVATAQCLLHIGTVRTWQLDYSGANAAFSRALPILEKALGPGHVQVGFTLLSIAMLAHKQGHYATAEPLYRRSLTILETKLGPAHERTALLEASLAKLCLEQRRNTEAEALLEKAIPILENAGESDPAALAVALNDLAESYWRDGRYEKAEPFYAHMLAIVEQKPAAMTSQVRTGLVDYVQMLRKMKRKSEALGLELQLKTLAPR